MAVDGGMWQPLRPVMVRAGLDPCRIESPISSGVPDVNYTHGWVELKYSPQWPPRGGPLRIDHFTPAQRGWLTAREKAGGRAFLMLKVGRKEWLLFHGTVAARYLGNVPREELYEICAARWTRLPRPEELRTCLT